MAASVMAFGVATSISALQSSFKGIDLARDTTLASQIIQSELERVRLMPWNSTGTSICTLPQTEQLDLTTVFGSSTRIATNFTATRTVVPDSIRADVKYITVVVSWKTFDGRSHLRSMRTMYAKNGLYDYYYTIPH